MLFSAEKRYDRIVQFCSRKCYGISKKGIPTWSKGIPMKEETKQKLSQSLKKIKKGTHPVNFKGGAIATEGYRKIWSPNHPYNMSGFVYEHILVAEKYLKRSLENNEIVHHINFNRIDNRPENLYVFANMGEHMRFHNTKGKKVDLISNIL